MKPRLLLYGCGSQALVVADIIRMRDEFELIGCLDDRDPPEIKEDSIGLPLLGGREQLEPIYRDGVRDLIVCIGDNDARLEIAAIALSLGFALATAVHPHASIAAGVLLGPGTVVKSHAVIEPGAVIKANVIISAQVYVGHQCIIEDGVHLSGGSRIGGKTLIGEGTWVGLGGIVINQLRIGKRVRIGAGSVVLEDIPDEQVVFGVPARLRWHRGLWEDRQT